MKVVQIAATAILSTIVFPVGACTMDPAVELGLKNRIVTLAADHYYADLTKTKISIKNYKYKYDWKFTDAGYECHDSDYLSGEIILENFRHIYQGKPCTAVTKFTISSVPKKKDGKPVVTHKLSEVSMVCESGPM